MIERDTGFYSWYQSQLPNEPSGVVIWKAASAPLLEQLAALKESVDYAWKNAHIIDAARIKAEGEIERLTAENAELRRRLGDN